MDKHLAIILFAVVIASGCADSSPSGPPSSSGGEGLEIASFDVSDSMPGPSDQAMITLRLRNHHDHSVEINDASLYNIDPDLIESVDNQGCNPGNMVIEASNEDYVPEMECTWRITIEDEESVGNFNSRTVPLKLNLEYESELSNGEPLKVSFDEIESIESRETYSHTYSNSEVVLETEHRGPVPMGGDIMQLSINSEGEGEVDSDYNVDYEPGNVFEGEECWATVERIPGTTSEFSCEIVPGMDSPATRNLIFTISYIYVKSPSLDIEVVNP